MSYILEALKKSELQREIGQVPGIDSEHEKPLRPASGKWLWAGIGVLLLNAGLLAVLLWPKAGQDTSRAISPVAAPLAGQQPAPQAQDTARPDRPPVLPVPVPVRQQQPVPVTPAAPVTAPAQHVASLPVAATQPVITPPVPVQPNYASPKPVTAPAPRAGVDNLPLWPQIPGSLFRQLTGGLRLDVHVYSALPQDRFVLINLQKYREGEQLQEGPLLDAITPEGVILSFQGQQFRVSAQ